MQSNKTKVQKKQNLSSSQDLVLKQGSHSSDKGFDNYLLAKGFSSSTLKGYTKDVQRFLNWLAKENIPLETLSYADVLHYVQGSKSKNKKAKRSIRINSLKHYFDYLVSINVLVENPACSIILRGQKRKTLYNILSKQELEHIYHSFEVKENQKKQHLNWYQSQLLAFQRNKIILGLMIYQGLNATDLGNLKLKDLKLREGKIFIAGTRRSNERELTLEAVQIMDLMEYTLKTREQILKEQNKESDKLIISAGSGNKINNLLFNLIKKLRKQHKNIQNLKQIRTSVITHWLKLYNLRQVQHMAGHRYVSSTEAYFINDLEGLLEDITQFHPLD